MMGLMSSKEDRERSCHSTYQGKAVSTGQEDGCIYTRKRVLARNQIC